MLQRAATAMLLCATAIGCAAPQRVFRWVDLAGLVTLGSLQDGLAHALERLDKRIVSTR